MPDVGSMPAAGGPGVGIVGDTLTALNDETAGFIPIPGRGFNVHVTGTFVGTVSLYRYINGTWAPKWPFTAYEITSPRSFTDDECQNGVPHKLVMTAYTSGTATVSLSQ